MAATPMRQLIRFGRRPHPIDRKKYGQSRVALYWASPSARFTKPGLYLWAFGRQRRILAATIRRMDDKEPRRYRFVLLPVLLLTALVVVSMALLASGVVKP